MTGLHTHKSQYCASQMGNRKLLKDKVHISGVVVDCCKHSASVLYTQFDLREMVYVSFASWDSMLLCMRKCQEGPILQNYFYLNLDLISIEQD